LEPIRFLHIPKTAGTTFTSILKRQYFGTKTFSLSGDINRDIIKFNSLPENYREKITLFTGHSHGSTGIDRADKAVLLTFLRDPISRVKSFCQHVSEGKSKYLIDKFPPEKFNLNEFLESGNTELSNLQTRTLLSFKNDRNIAFIDDAFSEIVGTATHNLFNKIFLYGIQEYFDESLILFSLALNWRFPIYISKNKKNNTKLIQFEKHHIERIMDLNKIDIEVYNMAKKHFLSKVNDSSFDKSKLSQLKRINSLLSFFT
jgi:hypothetical protein